MNCLLCLEVTESYKDLIVFNSSEWQELNMKYIIEKYLWKLEVLNSQSYICQACWQELYNFHKFYSKLEKAHSNLNDLLNTEKVTKVAVETGNEEEAEKIVNITSKVSLPEPEILFFKEEFPLDIFEKEYEEEASSLKTNSKRKCSEKKSSHDKKSGKNSSRKTSNKEKSSTEINELQTNETLDEIGSELKTERVENDKSDENGADIDAELKPIENNVENNKMEDEEEVICLKSSTKRKCSRKKRTNDNKVIARNCSRQRSNNDKSKTEIEIKKTKSDKSLDEIDKKLEVERIEKNAEDNSMKFDENMGELKTKLELEITENDAKQNKMEESDQYDSSTKLDKLSDEDKFIAEYFQITCDICKIPLNTFFAMIKHYKREHNQRGHLECCGIKFSARAELIDHINIHKNPEYFKCKYCNKTFSKRACLRVHLKNIHDENRVDCGICGKSLANESSLKRHMITHNTEEKMVSCKQCGETFTSEYYLENHKPSHHNKLKICDLCGKSIPNAHAFRRHMLEHEGKALPKICCKMCDRQFADKGGLQRHMRAHHPPEGAITEFKCAKCLKVFAAIHSLKAHIRKVHDNAYVRKCTLCDRTFKEPGRLREHMSRHKGEPLYNCGFCSRKFYSNGNYYTHRKICSKNRKEKSVTKSTENE